MRHLFREIRFKFHRSPGTLSSSELANWAQDLYLANASEPPLRGAIFAIEQLELHAKDLAAKHELSDHRGDNRLLKRLADSERVIGLCHDLMSKALAEGRRLTPAAEWLLDNNYLIEEQIYLARKHFPKGYSRQLPRLKNSDSAGLPRIYDLILEFISHVDGRVDEEALSRYIAAYQSVTHLSLGELWSVAIMLRLSLIENLRRVARTMSWQRAHRDCALGWVKRIDATSEKHENALLILADMIREDPPLSTAFVTQFTQSLQGRGATTTFILSWLEQRLADRGQTIEEVVRAESQRQAADQASMANSIASLRFINATEWYKFVETNSATEKILRDEPADVYGRMDFATRDVYRHSVEAIARRLRVSEEEVARAAVALAAEHHAANIADVAAHVGYMLVDEGKSSLERAIKGEHPPFVFPRKLIRGLQLLAYLGPVMLLAVTGVAWLVMYSHAAPALALYFLAFCATLAASQCAIAVVNWFASIFFKPHALPRMDFEHGIPDEYRTMSVVPTILTGLGRVDAIVEGLERRYLANRDPNLWFGILSDFADAAQEHVDGDELLLAQAVDGIEQLNEKYGNGAHGRFFLFHRPRLFNPQEDCWMGRERKRGKIEDFNALVTGTNSNRFNRIVGDISQITSIRYVITLDTDTDLPWGAGWRLVGAAAHPLNRPTIEQDGRRMLCGYAILQPRVSISMRSAVQSYYSRLLAGEVGIDPYTRVVSDVYQDLFAEASFIGKGIYDVGAFHTLLAGRFPDNTVLSHDLLESCYARSGQCSDVELLEDSPSGYLADVSRRHRWMRGDWQLAPWLGLRVSDATGQRMYPAIAALGRWKIFDNLRRSLVAPAYAILLMLGWIILPDSLAWTMAVLALLFVPELFPGLAELMQRPSKLPMSVHLSTVLRSTRRRLAKIALWLTFVPFEAVIALDATLRSLWRMMWSRKRLLEWQTAASVERATVLGIWAILQRMWVGPSLAVTVVILLILLGETRTLAIAGPVLLLWILSPFVAWWVSRPLPTGSTLLGEEDIRFLRRTARLTWRYFETFVGPQDNWLPPDNVQERPGPRVAHRTSPTNMGLSLLSGMTAYDLGYLSSTQLIDRTTRIIESMEQLERIRGHFFNWYDTSTRKSLRPLYVSTVDSGNLVGHLRVLRSGLLALPLGPVLSSQVLEGLRDTFLEMTGRITAHDELESVKQLMLSQPDSLSTWAKWLSELSQATGRLILSMDRPQDPEFSWWANAFEVQVRSVLEDLIEIAPWLADDAVPITDEAMQYVGGLDRAGSLRELGNLAKHAAAALLLTHKDSNSDHLADVFRIGSDRISVRIDRIESLAERCVGLSDADFSFLYDSKRKLLAIGYWVTDRRMDNSYYDLLASEARLASYVAIASGQIPYDHWFALGRRLSTVSGRQVLLSWSGSMFEYLMPLLVMPGFRGTLLDETCTAAVERQIEYGRQRGVPWGISESCFNVTDVEGTYQYRAFGVPGLGLQRGLADDVVIAPYASILALLIDPKRACANLQRMASQMYLGQYGFYEAIDFTPLRIHDGELASVIPVFMAHHHGMSLLALGQTVLGPMMQARFLSNPDLQAATLLLQERIPKTNVLLHPFAREAQISRRIQNRGAEQMMRVYTNPNAPIPEVHLLSNGRYHVMVSTAGGGYSRWNDLAVTRWREDPTQESFGVFCFIGDMQTHRCWSNTFQPTLRAGRRYEAVFSSGRAEFRRKDDQVETHTEIAVSSEDDLEIRRIRLTSRSDTSRSLMITAYLEVVLAASVSDELHRVFSNMFVEAELVPGQNAVLMTRRARSEDEKPPWMFCLLLSNDTVTPCSFETDRARFIGRGHTMSQPGALDVWGPLSGTAGAVLDPCVAIRCMVELAVDSSVQFDLIMGAAPDREAAMALVLKYQDHRMADRVFEVASTHSRAILGHLGASELEAQRFEQLASAVIFPVGTYRAPPSILRRNRKGQSGLWGYSISGDLPIVLLRVSDSENLDLVRDLLRAHAYWRMRGLMTDLVIWNEDGSGYRRVLNDQILSLIAAGTEAQLVDKPGGVFVRHVDNFPEEDRVLLQAVARIVIGDVDGPLDQQLKRWQQTLNPVRTSMLALSRRKPLREKSDAPLTPRDDLIFANGLGGFTRDGREYIIDLPPRHYTPAPWVNVIANPQFGTVISERGSAYTWYGNAQLFRLTPWSNDPVSDPSGEVMYIRDESSGRFFSPMPWPRLSNTVYACRHGFGYSVLDHTEEGLKTELTTFVSINAPVKFLSLRVKNLSEHSRTISVFASVDLVLGDLRPRNAMHIVTEQEPLTGAILARNSYNSEFSNVVVFFDCSEDQRSVSGDRMEFLGRNGDPASPAAMRLRRLSGHLGPGLDPCAAMQVRVELPEGAEREIVFVLGAGSSIAEAIELIERHRGVAASHIAQQEVWQFWNEKLGVLFAETPDSALNVMMNGWLPYQVLSCRMWGRSGFYQSSGAFGFRDQLQDCVALMHQMPELARQHLLRCAERQFVEGDVQHWWHPPAGRGVRTRCSDDYLWLPYAVSRYVTFTGDTGVLDEPVSYLSGRALNENEESYFDLPGRSDQTGTLYEHCMRAILNGLKVGIHSLPLMGSGDWNDGMNRVGHLGKGESVWLGFFLHEVLSQFAVVAQQRGDDAFATQCLEIADNLSVQIERHAWDGKWYRRAYFDNGEPLGSAKNMECRIDSLPQSWATISGVGNPERRKQALDSMWKQLVCQDLQIVQLFTPPFNRSALDPGYIKGYPPGVRENAGQYTHGAVWAALALALAGREEQAAALVTLLNPINHALDPKAVERYKVEPYVLAADIYSQPPYAGRGGWTWYTGSAAWLYRLMHEVIFGIDRQADILSFRPRVPTSWTHFKLHYRYYQTFYHLIFTQDPTYQDPILLTIDNESQQVGQLKLINDQREHTVMVLFGPCADECNQQTVRKARQFNSLTQGGSS